MEPKRCVKAPCSGMSACVPPESRELRDVPSSGVPPATSPRCTPWLAQRQSYRGQGWRKGAVRRPRMARARRRRRTGRRAHPGRELHATVSRTREWIHRNGSTGGVVVPVRGSCTWCEASEPAGIGCCMVSNDTDGDPGRLNAQAPKSGEPYHGGCDHPSNESALRFAGLARQIDAPPPSP